MKLSYLMKKEEEELVQELKLSLIHSIHKRKSFKAVEKVLKST